MNRDNLGNTWPDSPTTNINELEKRNAERAHLTQAQSPPQQAGYATAGCASSPVGAAIAGKQHLLDALERRRQWYSSRVTESFADAQRHSETIQRLTTAINILTLNPNFAEFCELLGLRVP